MNEKNAMLVANNQKLMSLKHLLEQRKQSISAVLPAHMTPERLIRISLVAASRNPQLLHCSPESIFSSLMDSSQLGLEPFTGLNLAWIIPYNNRKTGVKEAKFMPSYLGLVELARRSGQIKSLDAEVVYERDKWEIEKGLNPKLMHVPCYDGKDRGQPILVYAIARFKDGGYQFEVMTLPEVEYIRSKSQSPNNGPWQEFWSSMARKTVLKKLLKLCPLSTELSRAIAKDNAAETGEDSIDIDCIDPNEPIVIETPTTGHKADDLAAKIATNP
jgi:recombination protein RecT